MWRARAGYGKAEQPLVHFFLHTGDSVPYIHPPLRCLQVAGLPTNIPFLLRLATHPAFVAAGRSELNTAFIARHRNQLLAPQRVTPEVEHACTATTTITSALYAAGALVHSVFSPLPFGRHNGNNRP